MRVHLRHLEAHVLPEWNPNRPPLTSNPRSLIGPLLTKSERRSDVITARLTGLGRAPIFLATIPQPLLVLWRNDFRCPIFVPFQTWPSVPTILWHSRAINVQLWRQIEFQSSTIVSDGPHRN